MVSACIKDTHVEMQTSGQASGISSFITIETDRESEKKLSQLHHRFTNDAYHIYSHIRTNFTIEN